MSKKGFTLIELLIVIGILAILSSAVVVVLNPAQLFAQARDTQRMSDLATLQSALSYYLSTAPEASIKMAPGTLGDVCGTNYWGSFAGVANNFSSTGPQSALIGRGVTGTGWVPIDLTASSGGSPIGSLPADPTNSGTFGYTYQCNATSRAFEINAIMESLKYKPGGSNDVSANDGGNKPLVYEVGTKLDL